MGKNGYGGNVKIIKQLFEGQRTLVLWSMMTVVVTATIFEIAAAVIPIKILSFALSVIVTSALLNSMNKIGWRGKTWHQGKRMSAASRVSYSAFALGWLLVLPLNLIPEASFLWPWYILYAIAYSCFVFVQAADVYAERAYASPGVSMAITAAQTAVTWLILITMVQTAP